MTSERLIVACDFQESSGEGRLARGFLDISGIDMNKSKVVTYVEDHKSAEKSGNCSGLRGIFRYLAPYLWLWKTLRCPENHHYEEMVVLNYLPIWNFITFLLVPSSAKLAPITGSPPVNLKHIHASKISKLRYFILRNIILVMLSFVSASIIRLRNLKVLPATPFVSKYLHSEQSSYLFVSAVVKTATNSQQNKCKKIYDLIAYTNEHSLKNNELLLKILRLNSHARLNIALIVRGKVAKKFSDQSCSLFEELSNDEVIQLIQGSRAALICSLEGAGFFANEAAIHGLKIFCFPDTGASMLPNSIYLCGRDDVAHASLISDTISKELGAKSKPNHQQELDTYFNESREFYTPCD